MCRSFCRDFSQDQVHTYFLRIEQAVLELFGIKAPDRDEQLTQSSHAQPSFAHGEKSIYIPTRSQNIPIMLLVTPSILQMSLSPCLSLRTSAALTKPTLIPWGINTPSLSRRARPIPFLLHLPPFCSFYFIVFLFPPSDKVTWSRLGKFDLPVWPLVC